MPAWKGNLTTSQIADVITYIRGSWGNNGRTGHDGPGQRREVISAAVRRASPARR